MVQLNSQARKIFSSILDTFDKKERDRFGRCLEAKFDNIITGDIVREYKITRQDLIDILYENKFIIPKPLITK